MTISLTKKKPFTERDRKDAEGPFLDNPEGIPTDKVSIYDMHEDMKFVDAIPSEDIPTELQEEKLRGIKKDDSYTAENPPGF